VVSLFVGEDVSLGERAALRPEPGAELLEEPQVDVDILIGRAVERAHLGRRRAAPGLGLAAEEHRRHHRVAAKRLRPVGLDAVHVSDDPAVLRSLGIRTAHIGPVEHDGHGFVGTDINLLFRMLEARPLKAALAGSGAELALIVSDYVYNNAVRRYPSLISPDAFRPVKFQVKYTRARAWIYLPGAA
jgi:hypothetical protein